MNELYLGLGSNEGNRAVNLALVLRLLSRRIGLVTKESTVYETEAWGKTDERPYYNQVVLVKTTLSALNAFRECQIIEQKMGRVRKNKWGARIMDIDVLYFNDEVVNSEELTIPHALLTERRFVLTPLVEVAPQKKHPVLGKTQSELLEACTDALSVRGL
jgi:2-amino-4-hydroxy-6-hydroxymethyldihydropteridine diphosphokinase